MEKKIINSKFLLDQALNINNFTLSTQQKNNIHRYIDCISEWNAKINITGHNKIEDIIEKDIIDTLYLNMYIIKYIINNGLFIDFGCGAGFIGIIMSIIHPSLKIAFLDSNRKKINFVKHACRELKLKDNLFINQRAEEIGAEWKEKFDMGVSRATWKSFEFTNTCRNYVHNNGHLILMAGKEKIYREQQDQCCQGLEKAEIIFYKIAPKNYERQIYIFKKMN